jgi:hypothetical protein
VLDTRRFNCFAGGKFMHAHSIRTSSAEPFTLSWPVYRLRKKAHRLAVRLAAFATYCADSYSARVQYEDLAKLSDVALERRGIARGDMHRHAAEAFPKWPPRP